MKYIIKKDFIIEQIDSKITIFNSDNSHLYTFNKTASEIFIHLQKGKTEPEISQILVKRYKISPAKAKKDTFEIVSILLKNGIIAKGRK